MIPIADRALWLLTPLRGSQATCVLGSHLKTGPLLIRY